MHGVACLRSIDGVDLGAEIHPTLRPDIHPILEMINGPAGRSALLCCRCGVFFAAVV